MGRDRRRSKGKEINPTFWVFCEGKSEVAYINYLKSKYRLPIDIISKKAKNNISNSFINNYKRDKATHPKDKNYLMFDLDVAGLLDKLLKIKNVTLLCSNPCVELWFLLHYPIITAEIKSDDCIQALINQCSQYKKGEIHDELRAHLSDSTDAIEKAKKMKEYENPSTLIYRLIEDLESVKRK